MTSSCFFFFDFLFSIIWGSCVTAGAGRHVPLGNNTGQLGPTFSRPSMQTTTKAVAYAYAFHPDSYKGMKLGTQLIHLFFLEHPTDGYSVINETHRREREKERKRERESVAAGATWQSREIGAVKIPTPLIWCGIYTTQVNTHTSARVCVRGEREET